MSRIRLMLFEDVAGVGLGEGRAEFDEVFEPSLDALDVLRDSACRSRSCRPLLQCHEQ
jgi:hypothetical protein